MNKSCSSTGFDDEESPVRRSFFLLIWQAFNLYYGLDKDTAFRLKDGIHSVFRFMLCFFFMIYRNTCDEPHIGGILFAHKHRREAK